VTGITPSPIDLGIAPTIFTITGGGFADFGPGNPVVNFERNGVLLGQVRATAISGGTVLTVPFPTNQNSLSGALPGLSAGTVTVSVYNQTSAASFGLVGTASLIVSGCMACVTGITPSLVDLGAAAASFTITGGGFADFGLGNPVVNFERSGALLGQVRATAITDGTILRVPWPTNQNSLSGELPGLRSGSMTVSVYNQTSASSFSLIGSVSLTAN